MTNFGKESDSNSEITSYVQLAIKDGILFCIYKPINELDISIAKICVRDRIAFAEGHAYPSLFDITHIKHSTKEARDYFANEGNEGVKASAIVVSSPMVKMAANFFIQVNKPQNPTRMFTSQEEAIQWLGQFK